MGDELMAEQAEEKRKADYKAKLERMDDAELVAYAKRKKVDLTSAPTRDDKIAAIELAKEDQVKAAAAKKKLEADEEEQGRQIAQEAENRPPVARVMRSLNDLFCRDVPQAARSGSFEPEDDDLRFSGTYDVPDGKYRVTGSEWIFEIEGRKFVGASQALPPKFGGKDVILVD